MGGFAYALAGISLSVAPVDPGGGGRGLPLGDVGVVLFLVVVGLIFGLYRYLHRPPGAAGIDPAGERLVVRLAAMEHRLTDIQDAMVRIDERLKGDGTDR